MLGVYMGLVLELEKGSVASVLSDGFGGMTVVIRRKKKMRERKGRKKTGNEGREKGEERNRGRERRRKEVVSYFF